MKKLVFLFMASVAMTFAACGSQTASEKSLNDSDSIVSDSMVVDSVETDTLAIDSAVAK